MLYQLSYQAPWEQGGGKEGIQVLVLGAHYIRRSFSYETPLRWRCCHRGTQLDALAIRPNSSRNHYYSTCMQVPRFFSLEKNLRTWVGIEPTLSHLRCDALPIKLSSPLGARWWEGRYTSASSWCPLHQKKLLLWNTPAVTMLSPWHSARCSSHQA